MEKSDMMQKFISISKVMILSFLICFLLAVFERSSTQDRDLNAKIDSKIMSDHNCDRILDVRGFHNVLKPKLLNRDLFNGAKAKYLYIKKALVRDNGEAEYREPADMGVFVYGGVNLDKLLNNVRLYGPIWCGYDDDGSEKYEWEDYCTVYYNNYCITDLTDYKYDYIRLTIKEGDHESAWWAPLVKPVVELFAASALTDDIVFNAKIYLPDLLENSEITVVGDCDIPSECAGLTLTVTNGKFEGEFWHESDWNNESQIYVKNLTGSSLKIYTMVYREQLAIWTDWLGPYSINEHEIGPISLTKKDGKKLKGFQMYIYAVSCDGRKIWDNYKEKALFIGTERQAPDSRYIFTFR